MTPARSRPDGSFVGGAFLALGIAVVASAAGYLWEAVSLPVAIGAGLAGFLVAIVTLAFASSRTRRNDRSRPPVAAADRGGGDDDLPHVQGTGLGGLGAGKGTNKDHADADGPTGGGDGGGD